MATSTPEQLDDQADKVGVALSEVEYQLRELFNELNFADFDLTEEQDNDLRRLMRVRDLVEIASELYPYPSGPDRE